jgi:hypothetical protein
MLAQLHLIAGLSWDPAIRGILVVTLAVAILMGSIYLIIATNTGARLGMLIALGGLFGWMSILCLYWWISPPGIGPRGQDPSWRPVEIYVHEPDGAQGPAKTLVLNALPDPGKVPSAAQVIAEHPELASELVGKPENTTLPDLAGLVKKDANGIIVKNDDGIEITGPNILKHYYGIDSTQAETVSGGSTLGGWKVVSIAQAGEASATADAALADSKLFKDSTEYKKVGAYETGGDQTRAEACPEGEADTSSGGPHNLVPTEALCRAVYRVKRTAWLWHPARYQVIQVQPVIHQETKPGEPPPLPIIDKSKPVISVILIRDQGNVRAKPAYFFVICFSLFLVFVLMLHYRDKTLMKNLEHAEAVKTGKAVEKVEE